MEYRGGRKNFLILMPPDKQNYTTITLIYNIGIMHQTTINPTVEGYKSEKTTVFFYLGRIIPDITASILIC